MAAFGWVVVDHVQDYFDTSAMESRDHHFELLDSILWQMRRGIAALRRKVRQRVVAPVIGEAVFHEVAIVKKVVYWQEFDCRNTKTDQVLDGSLRRQPGVRTTQPFRDIRVELGESFDMEFVDNGLVPWRARRAVISPGKSRINDHSQGGIRCIVTLIAGQIRLGVTHAVAKEFVGPAHITAN